MAQVSLYMDENAMGTLRKRSKREGISISKFVARIVEDYLSGKQDAWPAGYWDDVYGCLSYEDAAVMLETVQSGSAIDESDDDACNWFAECDAYDSPAQSTKRSSLAEGEA